MRKLFSDLILLKYSILPNDYNTIIINQLLSNTNVHIVSIFKDYLLYDDPSEFLKRFYNQDENKSKLIILTKYYENSLKLYPNYFALKEGKYIYNNIKKKQKLIDLFEIFKYEELNDEMKNGNVKIFNSDIYYSILNENINDKSKMKDLFGSKIFNKENKNDSVKSIINLTNKLTDFIRRNEKDYSINNNNTKTRTISTNCNIIVNNFIKKNNISKYKNNNLFTKIVKYNSNNLNQINDFKNNFSKLSLDKDKIHIKLKEKNISIIRSKFKYPYINKNIYKYIFIKHKNKSKNNHSSIQTTNLQTSFKFEKKHNYILSMTNEFKISKANKINKIKEILNKSLKKKYLISNEFYKINLNNRNNKLLFPGTKKKKIYTPYIITQTNKNINIKFELNNSINQRKPSNSEKKKRKFINIIS